LPEYVAGAPAAEVKYRFNWEFPMPFLPTITTGVLGKQFVHVTTMAE